MSKKRDFNHVFHWPHPQLRTMTSRQTNNKKVKQWTKYSFYKRHKIKNTKTWYSRLLSKIVVWFFLRRLVWLMRIYSISNLSVRLTKAQCTSDIVLSLKWLTGPQKSDFVVSGPISIIFFFFNLKIWWGFQIRYCTFP